MSCWLSLMQMMRRLSGAVQTPSHPCAALMDTRSINLRRHCLYFCPRSWERYMFSMTLEGDYITKNGINMILTMFQIVA